MSRPTRAGVLAILLLALTACGATGAPPASTAAPGAAEAAVAAGEQTANPAETKDPPPVTASMEALGLSGEQYATQGDPGAPITVIEFSDFG